MSEEEITDQEKNIALWKSVEETNPEYMHEVKYPFKHLTIDAQFQILTATKLWGPYGSKWGVKNETFAAIPLDTKNVCSVIYSATFFYPDGEFGINSDIFIYVKAKETYKANNDFAKKVSTDAMTKGLSKLGFSADIFMGKYDGGKYDGIESFVEKPLMSPEQSKALNSYLKDFESSYPDKANWIKGQIAEGLTLDQAEVVIKRIKDFKSGSNK